MELHTRVAMIDTLLEEAEQKRTALTHALHAHELAEQGKGATHSAPPTVEEEGLQYEHDLWQRVETGLAELRKALDELEHLEQQRGLSQ
jgi:hypothetical protein